MYSLLNVVYLTKYDFSKAHLYRTIYRKDDYFLIELSWHPCLK